MKPSLTHSRRVLNSEIQLHERKLQQITNLNTNYVKGVRNRLDILKDIQLLYSRLTPKTYAELTTPRKRVSTKKNRVEPDKTTDYNGWLDFQVKKSKAA